MDAKVWQLSVGEQQRVEIAKCFYHGAQTLILDEPTSVLTPPEIRELFGITGRRLTTGEENYILTWLSWGFGEQEIGLAYEKTCMATGGLKWPYCNSILRSWHEQGFTTLSQIESGDRAPAKPASGRPGYGVQRHHDELSALERAAVDRLLNDKED